MPTGCFLLVCFVLIEFVKASDDVNCFHMPPSKCPKPTDTCKCKRIDEKSSSVGCCHIRSESELRDGLACAEVAGAMGGPYELSPGTRSADDLFKVTALHIQNATLDRIDASALYWRNLITLSVTDSKIQRLMGKFSKLDLVCLNFSSNSLQEIDLHALMDLHSLAMLDLSYNNLTTLPNITVTKSRFNLDISGNSAIDCSSIIQLMRATKRRSKFLHFRNEKNATSCSRPFQIGWVNIPTEISLDKVQVLNKLEEECPKINKHSCACSPFRLDSVEGQETLYAVKVDCSSMDLVELPPNLPANTISLNVSFNNITSLDLLSSDYTYHSIRELYADHNQISSIAKLEGTRFIENFAILSLRANNLNSIITYVLSNAFDRIQVEKIVHLGRNKVVCNCSTAQTLKIWLNNYRHHVPDYQEVYCKNLPERVYQLDQNKVCPYQHHWTDYIYYVIAAEITMFVLLIGKVTYDYWVFKTAGYLPWPASKMPKMPCDWVFEA